MTPAHTVIDSPARELTLVSHDGALTGLYYPGHWYLPDPRVIGVRAEVQGFEDVEEQLAEYFTGERSLDLRTSTAGDAFQGRVWELIARIPYGETTTYGELARELPAIRRSRVGRRRGRSQSALDRRPLSPRRRQGRQAHRLRRRPGAQATTLDLEMPAGVPAGSLLRLF